MAGSSDIEAAHRPLPFEGPLLKHYLNIAAAQPPDKSNLFAASQAIRHFPDQIAGF